MQIWGHVYYTENIYCNTNENSEWLNNVSKRVPGSTSIAPSNPYYHVALNKAVVRSSFEFYASLKCFKSFWHVTWVVLRDGYFSSFTGWGKTTLKTTATLVIRGFVIRFNWWKIGVYLPLTCFYFKILGNKFYFANCQQKIALIERYTFISTRLMYIRLLYAYSQFSSNIYSRFNRSCFS